MSPWRKAATQALISGSAASVISALALALRGLHDVRSAAGPNNGPSQWVYGRRAAYRRGASVRNTLVGYLVHHLSSFGWALLHERVFGQPRAAPSVKQRLGAAVLTAATANFVDFNVAPRRLRPGFEVQLSRISLLVVYAAFAAGLAIGSEIAHRRQKSPDQF